MKLGSDVLVAVVALVQRGLLEGKDISQGLRELDVAVIENEVVLSDEYKLQQFVQRLIMPTYVYRCEDCEKEIELVQKMSEKKAPECSCGKIMETVLQATGFVLKGSCWAKDGYK